MRDKKVIFMCNNKAVVHIINKETSKDKSIRRLFIRIFIIHLHYHTISIFMQNIYQETQCNSWPLITHSIPGCIPVLPTPRQGTDTRPRGSLEDLTKEACSLLAASLANSSKLKYHSWTWQMLLQRFPEVSSLSLSTALLCDFIAHLFCNGYSPNSISTHISAVS